MTQLRDADDSIRIPGSKDDPLAILVAFVTKENST